MKKSVVCLCMIVTLMFLLSFGSACYAEDVVMEGNDTFQQSDLKKQCLAATVTAINVEINRHQGWIDFREQQGNLKDLDKLQASLAGLKGDLEKYLAMDAEDYVLPKENNEVAWTGGKAENNSVLYVQSMFKNGPWYHLAGIVGDDYAVLQPNSQQKMRYYLVYPRSYWGMSSAYVYIADTGKSEIKQTSQEKRIMGEVFENKYSFPLTEVEKCGNYQIYLLKDTKVASKGKLILDSKKSSFDFTLSEKDLKEYLYIEFVSSYNNKTIEINEIKDDLLKVVLEPEMVLKKPAIYLYPVEKSQISITHHFKGEILNTYPEYKDHWTVLAEPNGNLLNVKDNRYYKYLFWDGAYSFPKEHYQFKSGFYVKNEDYVSFLQRELAIIGLNENEINDFIVFWLPVMNHHQNSFVHFRINDDIDGSSVLVTKPEAETIIRVFMEFSGIDDLDSAPQLPQQILPTFVRKGFTLVEWGGAEIRNSND